MILVDRVPRFIFPPIPGGKSKLLLAGEEPRLGLGEFRPLEGVPGFSFSPENKPLQTLVSIFALFL